MGKIDGELSVTEQGTAAYAIPLAVPMGRAGILPELSIRYDSGGGNGLLGVGFALSGLSAISRCPKTVGADGRAAPIRFDATDRFCLDGQRLVSWPGTSGELRPESSPFDRVVPLGSDAHGPTGFYVYARDGRVLQYGGTADSRLEGTRSVGWTTDSGGDRVRLSWSLSRVEDRPGNWMSVEYQTWTYADGGVEQRPVRIRYTGFGSLAPQRRIELQYENRPDEWDGYQSGLHLRTTDRLRRIEAWAPDGRGATTLVRAWELTYRNDSVTGRSLLAELRELDGAGVSKPPTLFEWELGSLEHTRIPTSIADVARADALWNLSLADIDGDGATELFYPVRDTSVDFGRYNWHVRQPHASAGFGARSPSIVLTRYVRGFGLPALFFDQDGDGDMDLLFQQRRLASTFLEQWFWGSASLDGDPVVFQFIDAPPGRAPYVRPSPLDVPFPIPRLPTPQLVDLDGNGTIDLANQVAPLGGRPEVFTAAFHDGRSWGPAIRAIGAPFPDWGQVESADIDGDGAHELLSPLADATTDDRYTAQSIRPGEQPASWLVTLGRNDCSTWADVNGDGYADRLLLAGGAPRIRLSTGRGFTPLLGSVIHGGVSGPNELVHCSEGDYQGPIRVLDYDGDGRDDLLDVSRMVVLLSRGPETAHDRFGIIHTFRFEQRSIDVQTDGEPGKAPTAFGWPRVAIGDVNADALPDMVQVETDPSSAPDRLFVYRRRGRQPDVISRVTDGFGAWVRVNYEPMTTTVYEPGTGCEYPVRCIRRNGHTLVRSYEAPDGVGGHHRMSFNYFDARRDLAGDGLLGFGRRRVTHETTGAVTETVYGSRERIRRFYPHAGTVVSETSWIRDPLTGRYHVRQVTQQHSVRLFASGTAYDTRLRRRTTAEYELTGFDGTLDTEIPLRRVQTAYSYDDFSNPTRVVATSDSGASQVTETLYENREGPWLLGLARDVRITSTVGGASQSTHDTMRYDDYGLLTRQDSEPDGPTEMRAWTVLIRGADGLIEERWDGAAGRATRVTDLVWDEERVFPLRTINPAGHVRTTRIHPGLGVAVVDVDENGAVSRMRVDGFGRPREEIEPDGSSVAHRYFPGRVNVTTSDGANSDGYHDVLGRPVREEWDSPGNPRVVVRREYDHLGRLAGVTRPQFEGTEPVWARATHDILGRPRTIPSPRGDGEIRYFYEGRQVVILDARGVLRARREDADGRIVEIEEPGDDGDRLLTRYGYGPFGRLRTITDANGNVTRYGWDRRGRMVGYESPDTGIRTAEYDGFGELVSQTDATGAITQFIRDQLGRIQQTTSADGTTTLIWDEAAHGIGSLARTESPDGVRTELAYDALGRASSSTWRIPEGEGGELALRVAYAYDDRGRLSRIDYPDAGGLHPFSVHLAEDARGRLERVWRGAGAVRGDLLWDASGPDARDAEDRLVRQDFGNGVRTTQGFDDVSGLLRQIETTAAGGPSTPPGGRLPLSVLGLEHNEHGRIAERVEAVSGHHESFRYDQLDRLHIATVAGEPERRYRYDRIGNLEQHEGREQRYGEGGAGPHALTSVDGQAVTWDANGRQLHRPGRDIAWTTFDLPRSMALGPNRDPVDFRYDALHARVSRSTTSGDVVYAPGFYERRRENGITTHVWFVHAEGRPIAQVSWVEGGAEDHVVYLHADQVGSTVLSTDESGAVTYRARYLPFGQRQPSLDVPTGGITIGFSGHEEDDPDSLVNMRGRLYDPSQGRFLSADPVLESPFLPAAGDRYAYIFNNPLGGRDPSGFCVEDDCWSVSSRFADEGGIPTEIITARRLHPSRIEREPIAYRLGGPNLGRYALSRAYPRLTGSGGVIGSYPETFEQFVGRGGYFSDDTVTWALEEEHPVLERITGFADTVSFGIAGSFNDLAGTSRHIDSQSEHYRGGVLVGNVFNLAVGAAALLESAASAVSQGFRAVGGSQTFGGPIKLVGARGGPLPSAERRVLGNTLRTLRTLARESRAAVDGGYAPRTPRLDVYRRLGTPRWRGNAIHAEFERRVLQEVRAGRLPSDLLINAGRREPPRFLNSFLPRRPDVRYALSGGQEIVFDLTANGLRGAHAAPYFRRSWVRRAFDIYYDQ